MNILIVDDNDDIRLEIAEMLQSEQCNVIQAKNGEEAFQIISLKSIDLIVSDIKMPKMCGNELFLKVREELEKEIPFIFITGSPTDESEFNTINSFGIECIRKPPDCNYLRKRIDDTVHKIRVERSLAAIGAVEEELTILFADIEGYTLISKEMSPAEVVVMVNDCLEIMSQKAMKNKGVVDKFIGDELMVVFGKPMVNTYGTEEAIETALAIRERILKYNCETKRSIRINIGICSGKVYSCALGNIRYKEWTVIGDAVNIASRLCAGAETGQIFIEDKTYDEILPKINRDEYEKDGPFDTVVKNTPVRYYEIKEKID